MTDRCWLTVDGDGPPVVIVHGAMDRASSFARVHRHLTARTLVRYDRRGYGRSVELGPARSFDEQLDDLLEVIERTCDRPPVVFGHSYGGTIAMATAATRPGHIGALVAYESPMPWTDWWPATSAGASAMDNAATPEDGGEAFMRRMIGDARWDRLPPSTKSARRREGPTLRTELAQLRPPFADGLPFSPEDLAVPVIAAHGTKGRPHHQRAATEVATRAPRGELVVVEGAGHGVHLTDPTAVVDLIGRAEAAREQTTAR